MSMIDTQNAKQIRDPMDVLITMELPDEGVTLTYSGYSTAKVADGELGETAWPMRQIADLQGEGFPLDGSCVLYDSSTSPSQANGKLGVRGNVGEAVTITITGNKSIASLFIFATGAESVTFEGTTTPIYNNVVTIPVGATSITVTLNPASETTRIEVSQIEAGAKFRITNENLIRATVSLRSDLSIIDPTLPESEINIEAYQDTDISEAVAAIPADTPIMYSAGYEGDMSPVRRFYVTGQVTWADNVLSIQGVDGVHFLEDTTIRDFFIGSYFYDSEQGPVFQSNTLFPSATIDNFLRNIGIAFTREGALVVTGEYHRELDNALVFKEQTLRNIIAWIMNNFHITFESYTLPDGTHDYWPTYIDAGRPLLRISKPAPSWTIDETDCGAVRQDIDRVIQTINLSNPHLYLSEKGDASEYRTICGSYIWIKDSGVFPNFDDYCIYVRLPYFSENGDSRLLVPTRTNTSTEFEAQEFRSVTIRSPGGSNSAHYFPTNQWPNRTLGNSATEYYTQVMPWGAEQSRTWAEYVTDPGATTQNGDIIGIKGLEELIEGQYSATQVTGGSVVEIKNQNIFGRTCNGVGTEMFPALSMKSLLARSNVTGSFRWKGDPRHQPRDVATFVLRDGTEETITLENITITHEGGGTYADYTYRKGIV